LTNKIANLAAAFKNSKGSAYIDVCRIKIPEKAKKLTTINLFKRLTAKSLDELSL